jgi:hypothetical protein
VTNKRARRERSSVSENYALVSATVVPGMGVALAAVLRELVAAVVCPEAVEARALLVLAG